MAGGDGIQGLGRKIGGQTQGHALQIGQRKAGTQIMDVHGHHFVRREEAAQQMLGQQTLTGITHALEGEEGLGGGVGPNLRDTVHKVCPDCVLWGVGGEARWIGNEAGWAGQTNWSTENRDYSPEGNGMYGTEDGWFWLPGESDAKATNRGWFYHDGESPHTPERLFQMYLETVGRNATLILNIPPNKAGILPPASVTALTETGKLISQRLGTDLASQATISVNKERVAGAKRDYKAGNMTDNNKDTYWATNDGEVSDTITLTWDKKQTVRYVELMEYIAKGQRVRKFHIETSSDGTAWTRRAANVETTTVGYKRIIPLNGSTSSSYDEGYNVKALRIVIEDSKACPLISRVAVY